LRLSKQLLGIGKNWEDGRVEDGRVGDAPQAETNSENRSNERRAENIIAIPQFSIEKK
jgi:hypothetical protein